MKTRHSILVLVLAASALHADAEGATPPTVALPSPAKDGPVSIERALSERRSVRNPAATPLSLAEVSELCFAAQGVTDEKGHRSASSAKGLYPLELYLLAGAVEGLAPGLYHYEPARNALTLLRAGDGRGDFEHEGVGQAWIASAPAIFVLTGSVGKMAPAKDRGAEFMWIEAGLAAQGFLLEATAMKLGSTFVGGFRPREARLALGLPDSEEVLAVLPVGHRR
jgi:SagB-type dehydrogenase family enzyme